jgi:hypothetical protein
MNCKSCIKQPGRCGCFPALPEWGGEDFNCCKPRYWDRNDQFAVKEKIVTRPVERIVTFACNNLIEEKAEKKLTPICANIVCSKRSWCGEEIAKKCKLFVPLQEQITTDKNRQEVLYETQM